MIKLELDGVISWITALQRLKAAGQPAIDAVRQALAAHGIEADNALLDATIVEDVRREALARQDASASDLGIVTGSTGE